MIAAQRRFERQLNETLTPAHTDSLARQGRSCRKPSFTNEPRCQTARSVGRCRIITKADRRCSRTVSRKSASYLQDRITHPDAGAAPPGPGAPPSWQTNHRGGLVRRLEHRRRRRWTVGPRLQVTHAANGMLRIVRVTTPRSARTTSSFHAKATISAIVRSLNRSFISVPIRSRHYTPSRRSSAQQ